ncbi:MFS transporter, YNFM family, putative membrane transport protein [Sphingomonas gellani]|uniref:MFS transporter, YNFM family, putative membrane transport protein n=1 Tax=Sphingomonas gellani TaxID=1166340 RepID=A0A1H8C2K9_9SPHN|nr:MFS transporter [Sphingomonas gellani]SEM89303.1 MFS transporter, YNFM family, putative membrane transport protein [Sphingomonas gellani]
MADYADLGGHRHGTPAYRRLTLAMLFAGFSTFSLLYAVQPLLPLLAGEYRLSAEEASLAVSLATGPLAFGILAAGAISDRIGRRPLMVFAMLAAGALTLLAAVMPGWPALLALRLLTGLVLAGVPGVAMAYLAEEIDAGAIGSAMGLYIAGSGLGGMGGRLVASLLADLWGWRGALGGVGLIGLAMAEAFRRLAPPSRRFVARGGGIGAVRTLSRDDALPLLFGQAFVLMGIFVTVYNYAAFRLVAPPYSLSQAAVGAVFLLYVLGSGSSAWFGGLSGRVGRRRVFWVPVAILAVGVALTAARPLALVVAGIGVLTIGFFGAHSIASAWVGRRAQSHRGQAAALYLFFYYLGSSVLGSAGGVAWTRGGWTGVTLFCLVLSALALLGAALLARVPPLPVADAPMMVEP